MGSDRLRLKIQPRRCRTVMPKVDQHALSTHSPLLSQSRRMHTDRVSRQYPSKLCTADIPTRHSLARAQAVPRSGASYTARGRRPETFTHSRVGEVFTSDGIRFSLLSTNLGMQPLPPE